MDIQPNRRRTEHFDLTAMVDVTFLLLIFFMITASFTLEKAIAAPTPQPDEGAHVGAVSEHDDTVEVTIDRNDNISVESQPVTSFEELVIELRTEMAVQQRNALRILLHPESKHRAAVMVLDAAVELHIDDIQQEIM